MPQQSFSSWALVIWLTAYALAAAAVAGSAWLASRKGRVAAASWMAVRVAWLIIVSLAVMDAVRRGKDAVLDGDPLILQFPVITGGIVVLASAAVQEAIMRSRPGWRRWGSRAFHLCGSLALLSAVAYRFAGLTEPKVDSMEDFPSGFTTSSVEEVHALTDHGTPIPLRRLRPDPSLEDGETSLPERFACRVIDSGDPSQRANCHGWVFTDGDYLVEGNLVDTILVENGYEPTDHPHIDDVIVYRGDDGQVIHTGRVKAVGRAGFTLIESKWGSLHTYLHLPEDQCYSSDFGYYRSTRKGHRLRLVNGPAPPPPTTDEGEESPDLARSNRPRGFGTPAPIVKPRRPRQG